VLDEADGERKKLKPPKVLKIFIFLSDNKLALLILLSLELKINYFYYSTSSSNIL
jgi:hypothetical protein